MVRVLCFCLTVLLTVLVFLAAKLGLLYLFGFQDWVTPPISDLDVPTPSSEEPVTQSAAHLEALQELRRGNAKAALAKARGCAAEHGGCRGLLGELYLTGTEVAQDLAQAMHWFQAGADLGDPDSQYALGVLYANLLEESSPELQKNEGLSILYLYAASLAGHLGAMMAMGYRHSEGLGAPRACGTAALNYIEVARRVAQVYSSGMPKAVELVRLGVDNRDRQMSLSEMAVFVEIAASGDANVAAAVGKRYLLGLEGFHQNYARAAGHLTTAAQKHHPNAMALLGYMYSLGLGVTKDLDRAYRYFHDAASRDDALGHNGLGFIHFHGTKIRAQSFDLAFRHFNVSAHAGSADGMFNLASLYLTGMGTEQSFQRAAHWYTQALDRGHTPAAYTLAVMHLNGIGAVRNCKMAVELLKRVCERGAWVSGKLREAYELQEKQSSEGAAWRFLQLAEAGHEVAQMNAAHLFDSGAASFLLNTSEGVAEPAEDRRWGRFFAQRHYELSAEQGNAFSELRLGDFAYYGWGFRLHSSAAVDGEGEDFQSEAKGAQPVDLAETLDTWQLVAQESDIDLSLAHYRRTATMRIAGEWMQPYVARAHFNLGYMHQFGIGVMQDLPLARRHYMQSAAADPGGTHTPITIMACLLSLQHFLVDLPKPEVLAASVLGDVRFHILVVHVVAVIVLYALRSMLTRAPRAQAVPRTERDNETDRDDPLDEGDSDPFAWNPSTLRRGHAPSRSPRSGSPVDGGLRRRHARSRSPR